MSLFPGRRSRQRAHRDPTSQGWLDGNLGSIACLIAFKFRPRKALSFDNPPVETGQLKFMVEDEVLSGVTLEPGETKLNVVIGPWSDIRISPGDRQRTRAVFGTN